MGLGGILRGLAGIGSMIPGPWQIPAGVASLGLGAYDATRKPKVGTNVPGSGKPGTGVPGEGAYGYAGVPSLAQLDAEWRGMREGAGAFARPAGGGALCPPPVPQATPPLGGGLGSILKALGPAALGLLARRFMPGRGGAPNTSFGTGIGASGVPSTSGVPQISAAVGMGPTYLPRGAQITAHPGEVAQVIPAEGVDPLAIPPGAEPAPYSPTPDAVRGSDFAFGERPPQASSADTPMPPPIGEPEGQGISQALLSYLPLILGGGAAAVMAHKEGQRNPPPPGQSGHLSKAFQGLVEGYAGGRLENALTNRRSQMEQQEYMVREAHKAVMEARGLNLDNAAIPDSLKQRFMELDQKYKQAISKASPGGNLLTTSEASEIIAIKGLIDRGLSEVRGSMQTAELERTERAKQDVANKLDLEQRQREIAGSQPGIPGSPLQGPPLPPPDIAEQAARQQAMAQAATRSMEEPSPYTLSTGETVQLPKKLVVQEDIAGKRAAAQAALENQRESARDQRQSAQFAQQFALLDARLRASQQKLPETAIQNVESLDMGRATMERLKQVITKAGLQDNNNPIGPKFEKLLYSKGIDPGELDRLVNQLSGLGLANMLASFSGRFRNETYMKILTGHMPSGGMTYKLMYNMAKDLLPYVGYKRKQIFRLHGNAPEVPYEAPDLGEAGGLNEITGPPLPSSNSAVTKSGNKYEIVQ